MNADDVERLIEAVTDAVMAEVWRRERGQACCTCHGVLDECCQSR